ncbi:HIT family protein [Actinoplanes sp. NPDC024001]|uniref:HIT family protein n=1 Tax=Actinoplanes sp. NPDC024001 TaxID=3154598 RepID=UPI0033F486AA
MVDECGLCRGAEIDKELGRVQVWEDELWRLSTSIGPGNPTIASSYLEPKRHIAYLPDLDGAEAATFGPAIARCSAALRAVTGVDLVFVYIFGGTPHLHVHLAPHREGDALNTSMIKGELVLETLSSGVTGFQSKEFAGLPEDELEAAATALRAELNGFRSS